MDKRRRAPHALLALLDRRGFGMTLVRLLLLSWFAVPLVLALDPMLFATLGTGLIWRNALPAALILLVIYGICGRLLFSMALSSLLAWLVYKANAIKELNMNTPLQPGDVLLGKQVLHNMGFFAHYTGHRFVLLLLVLILFAAVMVMLWRFERVGARAHSLLRIALTVVPVGMLYSMGVGSPWQAVYSQRAMPSFQKWSPISSARQVGFLAAFVRMCQDTQFSIPNADKTSVMQFARTHAAPIRQRMTRTPPVLLPDIVVVQSEAFFDPGVLKQVDYGQYAPNFERLAATGITGSLTTPTYGGGTIRTEFETLTGYPMTAFPSIAYPYFGLAAKWMPTVPHRLQALGYTTTLFHPFHGDFWNRQAVMPGLGFQNSYYTEAFGDSGREGAYTSDATLFNFVIKKLEKPDASPRYSMVITMENHGPWNRDPGALVSLLKEKALPQGLSAQGRQEMTYYLSHLADGDAALSDFAAKLLQRERWTILVFYGDHLPALVNAYNDIGFDDGNRPDEEHTRYMLLSNRPLAPTESRQQALHAYDLPSLLFDTIGLPEDGYLALASVIRAERSGSNDALQQLTKDTSVDPLQRNAALLEVHCRRKLDASGECTKMSAPTLAGSP